MTSVHTEGSSQFAARTQHSRPYLHVQELPGQEVHDVHVEVVVRGLRQQLAQQEHLPSDRQRRLLVRRARLERRLPFLRL